HRYLRRQRWLRRASHLLVHRNRPATAATADRWPAIFLPAGPLAAARLRLYHPGSLARLLSPGHRHPRRAPSLLPRAFPPPAPVGCDLGGLADAAPAVSAGRGSHAGAAAARGDGEERPGPSGAPAVDEPRSLLPPPDPVYIAPALWHALFAQGIVIKDVRHK